MDINASAKVIKDEMDITALCKGVMKPDKYFAIARYVQCIDGQGGNLG